MAENANEDPRAIDESEIERPPEPPDLARRIRVPLAGGIGLAVLGTVVILAAFGLFGESWGTASARSASVALSIEYPTRFRYKQINPMQVFVTNRSDRTIDTLTVSFDTAYITRFSNVGFTPSAARAWEVDLTDVRPGETRRIHVGLQAERYGRHHGAVSAFFAGSDTAKAEVGTFIFP